VKYPRLWITLRATAAVLVALGTQVGSEGRHTAFATTTTTTYNCNGLDGEDNDDVLHGGDGDDILEGGDGNDSLHGNGDADILQGNDGNDFLDGGAANDQCFGGAGLNAAVDCWIRRSVDLGSFWGAAPGKGPI